MKADNKSFAGNISAGEKKVFVHNAKILWISGTKQFRIPDMYDRSWALCKWWMNKHRSDPRYVNGKLVVVSMLANEYKEV